MDQAVEWVNGLAKSAGGLSNVTQIDSATLKYVFSASLQMYAFLLIFRYNILLVMLLELLIFMH